MIQNEQQLEDRLATPSAADIQAMCQLPGDVIILGATGKMGPSLAQRIQRATQLADVSRRIIAVARFSDAKIRQSLEREGIECIACDLLSRTAVDQLPLCPNVLYLAGRKFGTSGRADLTWASNTVAPAYVAQRFRDARIVCFSTGNVYPLRAANEGACTERDDVAPCGDYANSCLGRERVFEYFSHQYQTPCLIFRLNYAVDLRYGVLVDIARKVFDKKPVPLAVPQVNVIWQGDANSYALRALTLAESPPRLLNVTGEQTLSVRETATWFANRFGCSVNFTGPEGIRSLLSDASLCHSLLGPPEIDESTLCEMVAQWIEHGGAQLDRPTKFEVTDGKF
jgi:nucleoside-diphosphate-sugar epimerase